MRTTIEEKRILVVFWVWKLPEYYKKVMFGSGFNAGCRSKGIVLSVGNAAVRGDGREGLFRFHQQYSYGNRDI